MDGNTTICGASNKWLRPSLSIAPQLGVGGAIPSQENSGMLRKNCRRHADTGLHQDRLDHARENVKKENPARDAPSARAASTNSSVLIFRTCPRASRAYPPNPITNAKIRRSNPGPRNATSAMANRIPGNAINELITMTVTKVSSLPPTYPANPPTRTPKIPESKTTVAPTRILTRVPKRMRERISRPRSSLPNGCSQEGPVSRLDSSCADGS